MTLTNDALLKQQIGKVADKVFLFANRDGRVHVPQKVYDNPTYSSSLTAYARLLVEMIPNVDERRLFELHRAATVYVKAVQSLFGNQTRILTQLRSNCGAAFRDAYKFSIDLAKVIEMEGRGPSDISPVNVPNQSASPIYAKIEDNKIVLDEGGALHPLLRLGAIERTRDYLKKEIEELANSLENSNVDKRFVSTFRALRTRLEFSDDAGAIALGLQVRAVMQVSKALEQEISEVLVLQISSTLTHTSYFASQYQDWVDFVRNAQEYPSREFVEKTIDAALESVNSTLSSYSDSVDKRIPDSLHFMASLLKGDKEDRRNAVYATVRGVENICIAAVRFAYAEAVQFLKDAANKARPTLVNAAAVTIIVLTLKLISDFMPVIASAPELHWLMENVPRIEKINQLLK